MEPIDVETGIPVFHVLGQPYFLGDEVRFLTWLLHRRRQPRTIHVANVHTVVTALWNPALARAQQHATLSLADGRPLSLAGNLLGCWSAKQLRGPDLMLSSALAGRAKKTRHYFLGGAPGVAAAVVAKMKALAPGLQVSGHASPPFRTISDTELKSLVSRLRRTRTDICWLGLGAPKQEILMERMASFGAPCAMVGVGAGFDYFSGRKTEAPRWMQVMALEWAYRLVQEPRRLFWRYLSTNGPFVALFALEYAGTYPRAKQASAVGSYFALGSGAYVSDLRCPRKSRDCGRDTGAASSAWSHCMAERRATIGLAFFE